MPPGLEKVKFLPSRHVAELAENVLDYLVVGLGKYESLYRVKLSFFRIEACFSRRTSNVGKSGATTKRKKIFTWFEKW